MTHSLPLVLLLAVAQLPSAVHSIVLAGAPKLRRERPDLRQALGGLVQQVVLLGILAITWSEGWWTATSVGLDGAAIWLAPFAAPIVWIVVSRLWRPPADIETLVEGQRALWPRTPIGRGLVVATLAVNPVTEELVCRGVFVFQVHQATGSVALGVAFGLVVNVVLHVYQGRGALPWHVLFYGATVGLLYSPTGLLGAVVLHAIADLSPALLPNSTLAWIRAWRRQRGISVEPLVAEPVPRKSSDLVKRLVQAGPAILWGSVAVGMLVARPEDPPPALVVGMVCAGVAAIVWLLPLVVRRLGSS